MWLSQEKYIEKVLDRFNMKDVMPIGIPLAPNNKLSANLCLCDDKKKEEMKRTSYPLIVGNLMYAIVCAQPDIAHSMGVVSRFLANPRKQHWQAVKWSFRYLKGTSNYFLCFGNNNAKLDGYTDENIVGDVDSRKSNIGYLYTFTSTIVSWESILEKVVSLSITKA